jgi:hypothetical protein
MKRIIAGLLTFIMLAVMPVTGGAAIAESIQLNITARDISMTVEPDSSFDISLRFNGNSSYDENVMTAMSFAFDSYSPFTIMQGSDSVNNARLRTNYNYRFHVPADTPAGVYYIRYTLNYSYIRNFHSLTEDSSPADMDIVSERKSFYATITVSDTTVPEASGTVRIENLEAADTAIGHAASVKANLINTGNPGFTNVRAEVLEGNSVIAQKFIGNLGGGANLSEELGIPAFTTAGNKRLTLRITYNDDGVGRSVQQSFTLRITANVPLTIDNLSFPSRIAAESPADFGFNLLNTGSEDYRNAQVTLYSGTTVLHTSYLGAVSAQAATPVSFGHTFRQAAERLNLRLLVTYQNAAGTQLSVERSFTMQIDSASELEISGIITPPSVKIETNADAAFTLVNRGNVDFRNVQVFLLKDNRQVRSLFVGQVSAQSGSPNTINYFFDSLNSSYELRVTYENAAGTRFETRRGFVVNVVLPEEDEEDETDSGRLRIQSVTSFPDTLIKTAATVEFWLTNPLITAITGAEAFLYDAGGRELDSIYISSVAGNTTDRFALSFMTEDTEGNYSYTIQVVYTDADGATHTLERRFRVNTVEVKPEPPKPDEPERPANVIIQRIQNPAAMFSGVTTEIPFTLVNAGRGTAYHVQVFVEDAWGNELAREYIGNIAAATSANERIRIKLDGADDYELVLGVVYENADESTGSVFRNFSQRIIDYRASVTDIAGYDWIWQGEPVNIEFSVLNNGTESLLNANAVLTDMQGNRLGELFIGTIEPGSKKERLRFRNIMFWDAGFTELTITVYYENADMNEFSFSASVSAMINEMFTPEFDWDGGMGSWDDMEDMQTDGEGGAAWWVWVLIGGGIAVPGIIVLVIFLRKSAHKRENAEMENFIRMMAGGSAPAEPATTVSIANNADSESDEE